MNRDEFKIEICANGLQSCQAAELAGADRVELCAGIPEGGTSPSHGTMQACRRCLDNTLLHVIIRPRGGDFLYSADELGIMAVDIDVARALGADGVVFGCLTADGDVDIKANQMLMQHARGMNVTFHRAFDRCRNPQQALNDIISLGFQRVLTSGQQPDAEQGIPMLRQLQQWSNGRIIILAGCGVNENNIARIARETSVTEFHFSAREALPSGMRYYNDSFGPAPNLSLSTAQRISATIHRLL